MDTKNSISAKGLKSESSPYTKEINNSLVQFSFPNQITLTSEEYYLQGFAIKHPKSFLSVTTFYTQKMVRLSIGIESVQDFLEYTEDFVETYNYGFPMPIKLMEFMGQMTQMLTEYLAAKEYITETQSK